MNKQNSVPAQALPRVAWKGIMRELRSRTAPRKPRAIKVGASIQEIAEKIQTRQTPRFYGLLPEQAALLARFFPQSTRATIEEAEKIRKHKFDLLGSGEVDLGKEIDWHTDFKSGHKWPVIHHTRLDLVSPDGGFDVKVPWELSRFHQTLRLGQAYLYTEDELYAQEAIDQITHWIRKNPYEFGVNWAGPMDVAIRVVNWLWTYYAIIESKSLKTNFLALWLTSIRQHGEYLIKHLEDGWPRTNHLIANLTGLAYLGIMFPEFPEAERWRATGLVRLWRELEYQIRPDGMSYEASTSYHRLVTEMSLSVAGLCVVNGITIPEPAKARMRAMLDVIMAYTQPNGLAPQIGDADDGRMLPLTVHEDRARMWQDHRHLLALGSLILEREMNDWAGFVEPTERGWSIAAGMEWQDAFWCFASDAAARLTDVLTRTTQRPEGNDPDDWVGIQPGLRVRARALARQPISIRDVTASRGFEASGLYVMAHEDFHLTIDAGDVGSDGAGGHAHNDTLGLTLCAYGKSFLIDPGSYLYTSDPKERNAFRSTAYHNTLQIGKEEINRFSKDEMFRMSNDAKISVHHWISQPNFDLFHASHTGYNRLNPGITHIRQVYFDKLARLWVLRDQLRLTDKDKAGIDQEVTLWFHLAPLPVRLDRTNNAIRTELAGGPNLIILPLGESPVQASYEEGVYAPRYGIKAKTPVAKFTGRVKLPADLVLLLYPYQAKADLRVVRATGRESLVKFNKALAPNRPNKHVLMDHT